MPLRKPVWQEAATDPAAPFDTAVAHQARVYDYRLGGKDNFAAEQAIRDFPAIVAGVKEQRAFLARAVRYLLELLPPGVVQLHHWHPEAAPEEGKLVPAYCGLARKS
jgi:hypothetical protein